MMQVVGEEGTSNDDFIVYLKSEFFDSVYLQQNSFDDVDAACPIERQKFLFAKVCQVLEREFTLSDKDKAREIFFNLTDLFREWNYSPWESEKMQEIDGKIEALLTAQEASHA